MTLNYNEKTRVLWPVLWCLVAVLSGYFDDSPIEILVIDSDTRPKAPGPYTQKVFNFIQLLKES